MSRHMVTFIGQPVAAGVDAAHFKAKNPDPNMIAFRGIEFPLNVAVAVEANTDSGRELIGKLQRNNHFRVETADEGVAAQPGTAETDADPRNPNVHPEAVSPEAEQKRADRAAKKAAKA